MQTKTRLINQAREARFYQRYCSPLFCDVFEFVLRKAKPARATDAFIRVCFGMIIIAVSILRHR